MIQRNIHQLLATKSWLVLFLFYFVFSQGFAQTSSGDCIGAIPVCRNIYDVPILTVPPNNVPNEINPTLSCLSNGEDHGVWYTFTVQTTGILHFNIIPYDPTDDYDWAVFDLTTSSCDQIKNFKVLEVACNFSSSVTNGGITGANNGSNPQDGPIVNVVAGQRFVLYISNFSQSTNGYKLDFSQSTAQVPDNVPPTMVSVTPNLPCAANVLQLRFSENISCSTIDPSDLVLTGPGGPYTITSVSSPDCLGGASYSTTFNLSISPSLNSSGTFTLSIAGSISDVCDNAATSSTAPIQFNYSALDVQITTIDADCGIDNGSASLNVLTGTPPYTYTWSTGGTGTSESNLARGNYTVKIDDSGGCSVTKSFTISDPTDFTYTIQQQADTCSKGVGIITINVTGTIPPYTYQFESDPASANNVYTSAVGDSAFYVRITDNDGCWLDTTFIVNNIVNDSILAYFTTDTSVVDVLFPFVNFSNASQNYTSFVWSFPTIPPNTPSFQYEFPDTGLYPVTIRAYDINGCFDEYTAYISVISQFIAYIPNTFTPNNDNLNDTFVIYGNGIDQNTFEMEIYDRWGERVFSTTDFDKGWDGSIRGRDKLMTDSGVYTYRILVNDIYGNPHKFLGKIILMR